MNDDVYESYARPNQSGSVPSHGRKTQGMSYRITRSSISICYQSHSIYLSIEYTEDWVGEEECEKPREYC
jgi:hypothetical protein